ncbi:Mitochondrial 39S ribosomal protein L18 [Fasciola gigantica]|uniref:Mitochondrial 39S ribosomal protein L18 n=1 Tax=Fasciola gigantica TaxID=46835 RepID=A0A504YPW5_FASGI|nr:Mitochondrial 39S ribosomal protein L18 [Fasciola gigantica]
MPFKFFSHAVLNHNSVHFTPPIAVFISDEGKNSIFLRNCVQKPKPAKLGIIGSCSEAQWLGVPVPTNRLLAQSLFEEESISYLWIGHPFVRYKRCLGHPQGSRPYRNICIDVSAAENIGRILAHRCHQCGLINLFFDSVESPLSNESAFFDALLEGGVNLEEPVEVTPPEPLGVDYDSLTEEQKRAVYPSLIETLRSTPDWANIPYPYSMRPVSGKRKLSPSFQVLSKVRQGMVWDPFYQRMVLPRNKAAWQHEYERRLQLEAEKPKESPLSEDEANVKMVIPVKWQLE